MKEYKNIREEEIQDTLHNYIINISSLIEEVKNNNLHNKQWFLDALDELNKLSISW